jgi:hypothetical protein
MSLNYIRVLKNILKLDYGPLKTPVILLCCEWMKREDNRGNPTYIRDDAGFLVVNFRHKLPQMSDSFIFPSQATQVFFFKGSKQTRLEGCTQEGTTSKTSRTRHCRHVHHH